ncbi:MAG: Tat pathway signal protein [Candidatus Competibacteraceae bacterium]|nr:Tat pathway signal protein [Candidatus Competibacteraceae bacterium]
MSLAILAAIAPVGCSSGTGNLSYQDLIDNTWRHIDTQVEKGPALLRELVHYATLAANSHNTQPWRFKLDADQITILPDFDRRCASVDPDDHHLFISLGCATENLVLAAQAHGLHANVSLPGSSGDAIQIGLEPATPVDSPLFQVIPERQCTRAPYDGKSVPTNQLIALEAVTQDEGVSVQIFTDNKQMKAILDYVIAGNSAQMKDDAFVRELKHWIRFNESTLVAHRDGLFSASSGNPTLPGWLGNLVMKFAFTEKRENDKYREHIRSSAGIFAFISARNDKPNWIQVGRSYQRFALQATAFGVRHAHINQALEVPEVRAQFAQYLGVGEQRPDLLLRFGYGPLMPPSVRRPVDQVLI